jgi:hypothetical protein
VKRAIAATLLAWSAWILIAASGPAPPPARRAATPAAIVLAPVKPLVLAWRWARAQEAIEDGRPEDALEALRVIEALEPANAAAAQFRAHVVGRDLAAVASDSDERFARIAEALDVLERADLASGDPGVALARGSFLLEPWTADPAMASRFERRFRRTTLEAATVDLRRGVERAPGSSIARGLLAEALKLRGIERIVREGDWPGGVAELDAATTALRGLTDTGAGARAAFAWARFVSAMLKATAADARTEAAAFIDELARLTGAGAAGSEEIYLAASLLPRLIDLATVRLAADGPSAALSLADATDRIRRFADAAAKAFGLAPPREFLGRTAVVRLLDGVKAADSSLAADADRVAASLLRPADR